MYKQIINAPCKYNENHYIPNRIVINTNRPVSPLRRNPYDHIVLHNQQICRSPIRNRPADIVFLKNYIDVNLIKRKQTTPVKSRSPVLQHIRQIEAKNKKIIKKATLVQNICYSPIKTRPFNQVFKQTNPQNFKQANIQSQYYKSPYQIQTKEQMYQGAQKQNKKQNLQLFTQLLGEIKTKENLTNEYMKNYSTNKEEIKKQEVKKFTNLIKNKQNKYRDNQIETEASKIQERIQSKKFSKVNQELLNFSLGKVFKLQKKCSVPLVPEKIIIPKESQESLSKNDVVNESEDSFSKDTLNMDPCF